MLRNYRFRSNVSSTKSLTLPQIEEGICIFFSSFFPSQILCLSAYIICVECKLQSINKWNRLRKKRRKNHVEIWLVHACNDECALPYQFKGQTLDCAECEIDVFFPFHSKWCWVSNVRWTFIKQLCTVLTLIWYCQKDAPSSCSMRLIWFQLCHNINVYWGIQCTFEIIKLKLKRYFRYCELKPSQIITVWTASSNLSNVSNLHICSVCKCFSFFDSFVMRFSPNSVQLFAHMCDNRIYTTICVHCSSQTFVTISWIICWRDKKIDSEIERWQRSKIV